MHRHKQSCPHPPSGATFPFLVESLFMLICPSMCCYRFVPPALGQKSNILLSKIRHAGSLSASFCFCFVLEVEAGFQKPMCFCSDSNALLAGSPVRLSSGTFFHHHYEVLSSVPWSLGPRLCFCLDNFFLVEENPPVTIQDISLER